ncbi:MAG: exodeoxyribonuclease VII large subunit [Clostridiaceae bacterium]
MFIKTLTVSEVNNYIKKILDNDFILKNSSIKGEISNIKFHSSGHVYLSLKDEGGKINCVIFNNKIENLNFMPKDGMKVIVKGKVSLYPRDGSNVIYIDTMSLDGVGELFVNFENLKRKLSEEGLFDAKYKKEIPKHVKRIGVITSPTGAAIKDFINVAVRRNNKVDIVIYPSLVQGVKAIDNIKEGIEYFNNEKDVDLIVLARGGGSIEELWAFNEEVVAYSIFSSKIPIVSAIGHETDYTIADFVSDLRAPTPSAAAELVVTDLLTEVKLLGNKLDLLKKSFSNVISKNQNTLNNFKIKLAYLNIDSKIQKERQYIQNLSNQLYNIIDGSIKAKKDYVNMSRNILESNNHKTIINKGYGFVRSENNEIITTVEKLKEIKKGYLTLNDGTIEINVSE